VPLTPPTRHIIFMYIKWNLIPKEFGDLKLRNIWSSVYSHKNCNIKFINWTLHYISPIISLPHDKIKQTYFPLLKSFHYYNKFMNIIQNLKICSMHWYSLKLD
jgi:hypothetical protein